MLQHDLEGVAPRVSDAARGKSGAHGKDVDGLGDAHLKTYVGALVALAVALASSWVYWYGLQADPRLVAGTAVFAGFILLGTVLSVRISEHTDLGTWDISLMLAVVVLGPTWASLAALPAALYAGRRDTARTAYEVGQNVLITHLAGMVFSAVSAPLLLAEAGAGATAAGVGGAGNVAPVLYGTLAAGATLVAANEIVDWGLLKVKYGQPLARSWEENWRPYLLSDAVNVATAGLGVMAFLVYGPVAAVVVLVGAAGSRVLVGRSRERLEENRQLRSRVGSLEEALATSNVAFGTMMVQEMGRKDGYAHRHAAATAVYAADLAREMKLDDERVGRVHLAGLLHNIGMFGLPEELLLSTGKPNSVAWHRIAEHPARGQKVLGSVPEYKELASWVRWHHERPDGRGYPDKLRGPWIPLEAKILAVAQAYAAMVIDQPRRPGTDPAIARGELTAGMDAQFDGVLVRAFLRILDTESEGYRMADDYRFALPGRPYDGGAAEASEAPGGSAASPPS